MDISITAHDRFSRNVHICRNLVQNHHPFPIVRDRRKQRFRPTLLSLFYTNVGMMQIKDNQYNPDKIYGFQGIFDVLSCRSGSLIPTIDISIVIHQLIGEFSREFCQDQKHF